MDGLPDEHEAIFAVLRGAPSWITVEAVQDTLRTFRPYYGAGMTPGDALEILINMGNLFELLAENPGENKTAKSRRATNHAVT